MLYNIEENYKTVAALVEKINDEQLTNLSKFLYARIKNPDSYVVMLGETSSGKSTLLNGLLRESLLYTSVKPSTGAIVEIIFEKSGDKNSYYAINRNATMEEISRDNFDSLSRNPDSNLERLRLKTASFLHGMGSLRLFDTPGYGSIIEKHEELLSDFLPQSDLIVYTVLYKVGIQEDDFNFLNYANELISASLKDKETEFVLVINRVPDNVSADDVRVQEICGYVSDILHYTPKLFLVPNVAAGEDEYPLPECAELWAYIQNTVTSEAYQKRLETCFNGYVFGLLEKCEAIIDKRLFGLRASKEEKEFIKKKIDEIKNENITIRNSLIEPAFRDLIKSLPSRFLTAKTAVSRIIHRKIDGADKFKETEITAYINTHLMRFEIKKQVDDIRLYIDAKITELDRMIQDRLNTKYVEIQKEIELHFSVAMAKMASGIFKKIEGRAMEQSLLNYFSQFAGRGGTGIANGAKHLLKKFGDFFGHTFTRGTHNKLAHVLSKIGATSARAVGAAVVVVIETIGMIVEVLTWQGKLKKVVDKGLDKWYEEVVDIVAGDLEELKTENIRLLDNQTDILIDAFTGEDKNIPLDNTEELETYLLGVKERLGGSYG